jgi:hypothetical protein
MVGTLQLAAIGAFDRAHGGQRIVRTAHVAAGLGGLLLRNSHNETRIEQLMRRSAHFPDRGGSLNQIIASGKVGAAVEAQPPIAELGSRRSPNAIGSSNGPNP